MIDEAAGREREFVEQCVAWALVQSNGNVFAF